MIPPLPEKAGNDAGIPGFSTDGYSHVAVLVLENENFSSTWGPTSPATYLNNTLRPAGVFNDHYYATGHVSLDNYIAMVSGQSNQPLSGTDCLAVNLWICVQPQGLFSGGRNLADQLEDKGASWKGYMDGMPSPCFHADYSPTAIPPDPYQGASQTPPAKDYADRHNPFLYFPDIIENDARCQSHVRPYTELAGDIAADQVPQFSFITPDTCHDGHDATCSDGQPGGLVAADKWLSEEVPALLNYMNTHNGLLIVTLDENGFSDTSEFPGCCAGGPLGLLPGHGGRIGLLALGAGVTPGVVSTSYDHMSLLRSIEDMFGIEEHLNNASQAAPMSDVF
ncbi:MAG: phosphatidylinositol-3-phosphatase [Mycobacterium sp.]|nr:phosphatidylinositol-3-phosphatase [Mycobacterium sp.]